MIRLTRRALLLAGICQMFVASIACADVIVADDFYYQEPTKPLGTLGGFTGQDYAGGQNGPAGRWTGEWVASGEAIIVGEDYVEPLDHFQAIVGDLGVPVNFNFLQRGFQLDGVDPNQTLYFAVQARTGLDAFNLPRIWLNAPLDEEAQISMGFADGGFIAQLGSDINDGFDEATNDGEYHLLIGKLEVNRTGASDRLTVWLDPSAPETGESTFVEADVIGSLGDLDGIVRLGRLDEQCCGASGLLYFDNVAIGTTWEDVAQVNVPRLTLQVDPETGNAMLLNETSTDFDLKYYEIHSDGGMLSVDGWSSLDDQGVSGGAWLENSPTANRLTESNFAGSTLLAAGEPLPLGTLFVPGAQGDLVARVATSAGLFNVANVRYEPVGGPTGDFNGNGVLDAGDIDALTTASAGGTNPATFDLNGDALVNETDIGIWVNDLFGSWIGDADLDGQFNSSDLVTVLASGTYEANIDSVWSTGDFNGDGRTNSSDLVSALAGGGYEAGPRAAVAAVPEPSAVGLLLLAMTLLATRARRIA